MYQEGINKSEAFYQLLRKTSFPFIDAFSCKNIDYLFEISDLRQFFDWFFVNVNENCCLSKQELDEFLVQVSSGQIIWDLNKLNDIVALTNSDKGSHLVLEEEGEEEAQDIETLKRSIDQLELELAFLNEKFEFMQSSGLFLSKRVIDSKSYHQAIEKNSQTLNEKDAYLKSACKTFEQQLHKSLGEFQKRFCDEISISNLENSLGESDLLLENYLSLEQGLLVRIKELSGLEIDCMSYRNRLNKSEHEIEYMIEWIRQEMTKNELEDKKIQESVQLIAKNYKEEIEKWFKSKLKKEASGGVLDLMTYMLDNMREFLKYSNQELVENASLKLKIEQEIRKNEEKAREFETLCIQLSTSVTAKIFRLSNVKMINILNKHMIKKTIDLKLALDKQEKLLRHLNQQKLRVEFLCHLKSSRLIESDCVKQLVEELLTENSDFFISKSNSNFSQNNATCLKSNLLSSTMISLNPVTNQIKPDFNLSGINSEHFAPENCVDSDDSDYLLLLNQFLIEALTKLNSRLSNNDDLSELISKSALSVNFDDNLDYYIGLSNAIQNYFTLNTSSTHLLDQLNRFHVLIRKSIDHFYLDEEDSINERNRLHNFNEINIQMPKQLRKAIDELDAKTIELQGLFSKLFQKLKSQQTCLNQNEFEQMKRDLFVCFYCNPQQLDRLIEHINSLE